MSDYLYCTNYKNISFIDKLAIIVSSWFFIGFAPFAPGTFGTIFGIPLCFILSKLDKATSLIILVLLCLLAAWTSDLNEKLQEKKDPGEIVIDEVLGISFTMFALPFTLSNIIISLIIFRLIDILKPQPIRFFDKNITGGLGVVFDDVLAGIISNIIIKIVITIELF